jgi:hypothetical protein
MRLRLSRRHRTDPGAGDSLNRRLHVRTYSRSKSQARMQVIRRRGGLVRKEGVEPPRPFGHKILSLARLPVPPLPQCGQRIHYTRDAWCAAMRWRGRSTGRIRLDGRISVRSRREGVHADYIGFVGEKMARARSTGRSRVGMGPGLTQTVGNIACSRLTRAGQCQDSISSSRRRRGISCGWPAASPRWIADIAECIIG